MFTPNLSVQVIYPNVPTTSFQSKSESICMCFKVESYNENTMCVGHTKLTLPIRYNLNANICSNVLVRVTKTTNEHQMDCEVGTWAYNF